MKNYISVLLLVTIGFNGISQSFKYEYNGRYTPVIKKEQLNEARFISDVMPEFTRYMALLAKEYVSFKQFLKLENSESGSFSYPNEYFHQQKNYEKIMEYVSIEISTMCNGKIVSSQNKNNTLTTEQKNNLMIADLGADITIKIKFKYKYQTLEFPDDANKIYEAKYTVTIVPETEALYPGGFKQFSNYINENVINKTNRQLTFRKFQQLIAKFTITEEGKIINAKITNSSADLKTDKLLLDAINKMPKWKPAENAKGTKVKQEFVLPLGGSGC